MLDKVCFEGIQDVLSIVDHSRKPDASVSADPFGDIHLLLFGDFKQLPPASSQAPFIIIPSVVQTFEFRCLRENRRVVQQAGREAELENFHQVLSDISVGRASNEVRQFICDAYLRGARIGNAENCDFEGRPKKLLRKRWGAPIPRFYKPSKRIGSTAVMTKRRYRDRWRVVGRFIHPPLFRALSGTAYSRPHRPAQVESHHDAACLQEAQSFAQNQGER